MDIPRPRIFISSVVDGYSDYRNAAAEGIRRAGGMPIRAEDHPASSSSPRSACIDMVRSADAAVFLLGARYGFEAPSRKAVTEEEYDEARRGHKRIFVFLEANIDRQPRQQAFVSRIQDYVDGHWRKEFATASELGSLVEDAVHEAEMRRASPSDDEAATERIRQVLACPPDSRDDLAWIVSAWTTSRSEEVVDPLALGEESFQRQLKRIAHECEPPLLDYDTQKTTRAGIDVVRISQGDANAWSDPRDLVTVEIRSSGTLAIWQNVTGIEEAGVGDFGLNWYISPETAAARPRAAWAFANAWWNTVDEFKRHDPILCQIGLADVGTRRLAEIERSRSGGIPVPMNECPENPILAYDIPRTIARAAMEAPVPEIDRAVRMLERRFDDWSR